MAKEKRKPAPQQMTVFEAGKLGGEKTAATHGRDFYERIGREGGRAGSKRRKNGQNGAPRRTGSRGSRG
jgi:hypothetical protein